jgi:RNA polymerase sigma-70 factor, ECF subfamily
MGTFLANGIDIESDGALVAAAKRGDAQAFEQLVLRHHKRVLAVAQRITKNREDAEDVAQESFRKAFLHLGDFQEQSKFATWLTRIAMNESFMLLRGRRKVSEVLPMNPDDESTSISEAFVDQSASPEESCWRRERTELLTRAITRLAPRIRRTILLRFVEERSVEETAQILGTTVSAVKSRISRGHRKLGEPGNLGHWRGLFSAHPRKGPICRGAVSLV